LSRKPLNVPHPGPPPGPLPNHPLKGTSPDGVGVEGDSTSGVGVYASSGQSNGLYAESNSPTESAIFGLTGAGTGVEGRGGIGVGVKGSGQANGVLGTSNTGTGVEGDSQSGVGVKGTSSSAVGVYGTSAQSDAIKGVSSSPQNAGVSGTNDSGGNGVWAEAAKADAIFGRGGKNGVHGETASATDSGVWGNNTSTSPSPGYGVSGTSTNGFGVFGQGKKGAAMFAGDVHTVGNVETIGNVNTQGDYTIRGNVTTFKDLTLSSGNLNLSTGNVNLGGGDIFLTHADCAEDFDVSESDEVEPGTVMVVDEGGAIHECKQEYDKRIVGVVSGAGNNKPAIILDRRQTRNRRVPVALMGKVYCKADAEYSPINVGDLLTSSQTAGHAMKAQDAGRALGSVVGKALAPLKGGRGLIPVLIALQ
jgi:hypothetical protein